MIVYFSLFSILDLSCFAVGRFARHSVATVLAVHDAREIEGVP